jgi:hypothetical protein
MYCLVEMQGVLVS